MPIKFKVRFLFILLAAISLVSGLWAGALRLGWEFPVLSDSLALAHGPLMAVGFLGTLIGLERAVALGHLWPYGAPLCSGLAAVSLLVGFPARGVALLGVIASFFLTLVFISLYRQAPAAHFVVMAASALAWMVGNALWLGGAPLFAATPWWAAFLVLMIAGERLQLSRVMQPSAQVFLTFHLCATALLLGLIISLVFPLVGIRIAGAALLAVSLWLLRYDMAWRNLREPGLARYMAICLLSGYNWLAVSALLWIAFAQEFQAGLRYDAMLHALFLGFVFTMIFAHAPVIFPAIAGIVLPFRQFFYLHLVLLQVSLLMRVIGDLLSWIPLQKWGGLLNIAAILLFLIDNICAMSATTKSSTRT